MAVGDLLDHRLFAVDVFTGVHGVDGDAGVPVVGGADDDGVDVLLGQELAVVAGSLDVRAPDLLRSSQPPIVDVSNGDEFSEAGADGRVSIAGAHAAGADEGEADFVVRAGLGERGGDGSGRGEEVAAGGHGWFSFRLYSCRWDRARPLLGRSGFRLGRQQGGIPQGVEKVSTYTDRYSMYSWRLAPSIELPATSDAIPMSPLRSYSWLQGWRQGEAEIERKSDSGVKAL